MGGISFADKTRIIIFAFLVPIALLGWSVWQGYRETRNFTTGELRGLQLMKTLVPLSREFVLAHNTTLARKVPPGVSAADTTVANDVKSLFSQLEQEMQLTPDSQTLQAALAAMHQSWEKAKAATLESRVSGASTVFAPVVSQSTELLQQIAD